jgi:hypothetical protein
MEWLLNFDLSSLSTGVRIALAMTISLPLFGGLLIKFKPETLEIGVDVLSLFSIKFKFRKKFREELEALTPDAEHQFKISPLKAGTQPSAAQTLPPRESALRAWENLGKVFNKAMAIYGQQSTRSLELQDAMNLLCSANIISGNQASVLLRFYQLGKDIQDNPSFAPGKKSSYEYQQITDKLTEWLNNEINRNLPIPKKPPRKTMVEESFIPPGKEEHPAVALLGIKGASKGLHFVMKKKQLNMGANSDNDIVIAGDEYVSGNHACLYFESGTLRLTDLNSRNGTYLNGKRFADASLPVNFGDEIQIGNSVFRVSAAHA